MRKPILSAGAVLGLILVAPFFFSQCRKTDTGSERMPPDLIAGARAFVAKLREQPPVYQPDNPRNDRTERNREELWASAAVMTFRGWPAVVVPLHSQKDIFLRTTWGGNHNFRLDNQEKLLVYQDSLHAWHAELVTTLPDTTYLNSDRQRFSGMILVDDWWGNPINKFHYTSDGRVERYNPNQNTDVVITPKKIAATTKPVMLVQTCTYIYGYNYAVGAENDGEYWVEFVGCTSMYLPETVDAGGGGSSYSGAGGGGGMSNSKTNLAAAPVILSPTHIIVDIKDYLKCFQNIPGANFQVTVCVDQPSPGSRNPWVISFTDGASGSGATSAGHTYLILTENMPDGRSITRNVGFYPSKFVWPLSPPVPGVLNNDENSPFNIAGQYNISSALFFAMLQFISGAAGDNYQVNTYNCTNFVLDALDVGHIYLPRTIGYWLGGMGVDPGDLGEDIRGFDFTGMSRITTPFFHSNLGTCD